MIEFLEQVIEYIKQAGEEEEIPYSVNEEKRIYGLKHMTKAELNEVAAEREISGRSKLKRDELLDAIVEDIKQEEA